HENVFQIQRRTGEKRRIGFEEDAVAHWSFHSLPESEPGFEFWPLAKAMFNQPFLRRGIGRAKFFKFGESDDQREQRRGIRPLRTTNRYFLRGTRCQIVHGCGYSNS